MSSFAKSFCALGGAAFLGGAALVAGPAASASATGQPTVAPSANWSAPASLQTTPNVVPMSASMSADGNTALAGSVAGASYDSDSFTGTVGTVGGGNVSWQPPTTISASNRWVTDGQVLVSQDGKTAAAAWDEETESGSSTAQTTFFASGPVVDGQVQWGAPHTVAHTDVSDVAGDGPAVEMALSADGSHVTLVWCQVAASGITLESTSGTIDGASQQWASVSDIGPVAEGAWSPRVAMSADGSKIVATWQQPGGSGSSGIDVASGSVSGTEASWNEPTALVAASPQSKWFPFAPQVQVSADGSTALVAWGTSKSGGSDPSEFASTLDLGTGTSSWTAPKTIPGVESASAEPAQIALSANGSQAIAVGTDAVGNNVVASAGTVAAGGVDWGASTTIFSGAANFSASAPSIALSGNGRVAAVAVSYSNGTDTNAQVDAVSGTIDGLTSAWSKPTNLDPSSATASAPSLAASADGSSVVAVWSTMGSDTETLRAATATVSTS